MKMTKEEVKQLMKSLKGLHMTNPKCDETTDLLFKDATTEPYWDYLVPEIHWKTGICTGVWLDFGIDDTRENFNCCEWDLIKGKPYTNEEQTYEGRFGISFWKRYIKKFSEVTPDKVLLTKVWFLDSSFSGCWPEGPFRSEQCCIKRRDEVYWWELKDPQSVHSIHRKAYRRKAKIWCEQIEEGYGIPTSFCMLQGFYQPHRPKQDRAPPEGSIRAW